MLNTWSIFVNCKVASKLYSRSDYQTFLAKIAVNDIFLIELFIQPLSHLPDLPNTHLLLS